MLKAFLWASTKPRLTQETDFDHILSLVDVVSFLNSTDKLTILVNSVIENESKSAIDRLIGRRLFSSHASFFEDFELDQRQALALLIDPVTSFKRLVHPEKPVQLRSLLHEYLRNVEYCGYRFLPLGLRRCYNLYFRQMAIPLNHQPCLIGGVIGAVQNPGVDLADFAIFSPRHPTFAHARGVAIDFGTASALSVDGVMDSLSLADRVAITTQGGHASLWLPNEPEAIDLGQTSEAWLYTNASQLAIVMENGGRYDLYIYPDMLEPRLVAHSVESLELDTKFNQGLDWFGFAEDTEGGLYLVDMRRRTLLEQFSEVCVSFSNSRLRAKLHELCERAKVAISRGSDDGYDEVVAFIGSETFDKGNVLNAFRRFLLAPSACSLH